MHNLTLCLLFVAYMAGAFGFGWLNGTSVKEKPRSNGLKLLDLFFMPANLLGLLLAGCVLTPFWWLYPERHVHTLDVEGPEEEMKAWTEYKALLSRKSFWRRLAQKLRLVMETEPKYPMPPRAAA